MDINFQTPSNIHFKAMKSSQFKSLEYSAMRKFKAPIEKFKDIQSFYTWSTEKCSNLAKKELGGRDSLTQLKRRIMKNEWLHYLTSLNDITMPVILLIMSSMLKGLKDNNSDLMPQLDEDVFQKTLQATKAKVDISRDSQFDFRKIYVENLRLKLIGKTDTWVVIPSKKNDEVNYCSNLKKLKTLSPRTWCTKNEKAEDYLENNDIHIFYKKGCPEIGIRIKDGKVYDIVGFENNGKIPQKHLSSVIDYIKEKNLNLGLEARDQIESAQYLQNTITLIRNDIGDAIDKNNVYKIMEYFGFRPEYMEDGSVSIAEYKQPRQGNFSDFGIDENKLFEQISEIRGNAFFRNCAASSLKNIKKIGGIVNFSESSILDAGALEKIGGDLYLANSKIFKLPNLRQVDGIINCKNSLFSEKDLKSLFV